MSYTHTFIERVDLAPLRDLNVRVCEYELPNRAVISEDIHSRTDC